MKNLIYILVYGCFFNVFSLQAQNKTLSSQAQISLLTSTPGPLLYQAFGHSAIRVQDPVSNLDQVYNYGTFDFDTDNFYWKFARGNLLYSLSIKPFQSYVEEYKFYNQTIYEQVFNFNLEEKNKLYSFLQENHLPANRFYLYDYFQDNCATRIYDIIFQVFAEKVQMDDLSWYQPASYRESIDPYLRQFPWSHLGIDISLGMPTDRKMSPEDYMFLPEYLMLGLQNAIIDQPDFGTKPLVKSQVVLHDGTSKFPVDPQRKWWVFILLITFFAATFLFTVQEIKKNRIFPALDISIFGLLGILGIYLSFLWIGTQHTATFINADLLWATPIHLIVVFYIWRGHYKSSFLFWYFSIFFLLFLIYLLMWVIDFKNFNWLIVPLLLIYGTRLFRWNFFRLE